MSFLRGGYATSQTETHNQRSSSGSMLSFGQSPKQSAGTTRTFGFSSTLTSTSTEPSVSNGPRYSSAASRQSTLNQSSRSVSSAGDLDGLPSPLEGLKGLTEDEIQETAFELLLALGGDRSSSKTSSGKPEKPKSRGGFRRVLGLTKRKNAGDDASSPSAAPPTLAEILRRQMEMSEATAARLKKAFTKCKAVQGSKDLAGLILPVELLQWTGTADFINVKDYQHFQRRQLSVLEEGLILHPSLPPAADNMSLAKQLKQSITQLRSSANQDLSLRKNSETMQLIRSASSAIAEGWAADGAQVMHWADGFPLNAHLYLSMLRSLFDVTDESSVVEEAEDLLDYFKSAWPALGVTPMFHGVCFAWVLIRHFIGTGAKEHELLLAAETELRAIAEETRAYEEEEEMPSAMRRRLSPQHMKFLRSLLTSMQSWADGQLFMYHETFGGGGDALMENLVGIALEVEEVLQAEEMQGYGNNQQQPPKGPKKKCEDYIRSSIKAAFAARMREADELRGGRGAAGEDALPLLARLADEAVALARTEEDKFSPVFRRYHSSAGAVACATLHSCFKRELKQYLQNVSVLSPEAAVVLFAASRMEAQLINMAVADSVEAEDGGRAIIREMSPYDADNLVAQLAQRWVAERSERLKVFADRALGTEEWDPKANPRHCGASVMEVLQLVDETIDAFFALRLPSSPQLVKDLVAGLDKFFQRYGQRVTSVCGSKDRMVPPLTPLTRYKKDALLKLAKERKRGDERGQRGAALSRVDSSSSLGPPPAPEPHLTLTLTSLCVRLNTLFLLETEIDEIDKKLQRLAGETGHCQKAVAVMREVPVKKGGLSWNGIFSQQQQQHKSMMTVPSLPSSGEALPRSQELTRPFQETKQALQENFQEMCAFAACKVVYNDIRVAVLSDLYAFSVTNARIPLVLSQLEPRLAAIATLMDSHTRNDVVRNLLEATVDALLRVLLAGGPTRAFLVKDSALLDDDMEALKDMFIAEGEGLPPGEVDSVMAPLTQVLNLFHFDTATLIQNYNAQEGGGTDGRGGARGSVKSAPPPLSVGTGGYLGFLNSVRITDPAVILHVLCHRADHAASKFLKTRFDLPKSLK